MSIIVYHGGTDKIMHPQSDAGRANLDFGLGFYVTDMLSQQLIDKYLVFDGTESV